MKNKTLSFQINISNTKIKGELQSKSRANI
jgi:hypothetical protein